jgi:hypothetical protein
MKNLSKNMFISIFLQLIADGGSTIKHLNDDVYSENTGLDVLTDGQLNDELVEIRANHDNNKAAIKRGEAKKIAESRDLDEEDVASIQDAIIAHQDISQDDRYAYEKFKLKTDYRYHGDISEDFVISYSDIRIRRIYKNLNRISTHEDVRDALRQIQNEERANYNYVMELTEGDQNSDINRKYVFEQHRIAIGLIITCGWDNIRDPKYVNRVVLAENIRSNEQVIIDGINTISIDLQIRRPKFGDATAVRNNDVIYVNIMLSIINRIISTMYGVLIKSNKDDRDMFNLRAIGIFTNDPTDNTKRPVILSPRRG